MKPIVLCIMDGIGFREEIEGNAVKQANTPNLDKYLSMYPNSLLEASGEEVGIPEGQMGNSEVGHMNIGAGRIVKQPLKIINDSIKDNSFFNNKELLENIKHAKDNNSKLHIMGLLSDGGVHSHISHLFVLLDLCKKEEITNVYIHAIMDGRDTKKDVALIYLDKLQKKLDELGFGSIASVSGRYYAMDRDNRWDRIKKAYDVIIRGEGTVYPSYKELININYEQEIYDEFINPGLINKNGLIEDNDSVIIFNFRSDRLREIGITLTSEYENKKLNNIKLSTLFPISNEVVSTPAFEINEIKNDLGEYIASLGLKQLRIAETEKYSHVTFFFNGQDKKVFDNYDEVLIPSPKVATYDLKPEMSALEITDKVNEIMSNYDLIILNYANGDMVGHTGKIDAAIKAVENVDKCIGRLHDKVNDVGGLLILTADHGNCEEMIGKHIKTHSTNPVPFIICKNGYKLSNGKLGDIAPTILSLMEIEKPAEMTGTNLLEGEAL